MSNHIPLNQVAVAVQNAVEQVLGKHGALGIEKLWVGFVAPDTIATEANANKIASVLGKEGGIAVQPSVAVQGGAAAGQQAIQKPGHIIGIVYAPPRLEQ